jgi:hypothetical protein
MGVVAMKSLCPQCGNVMPRLKRAAWNQGRSHRPTSKTSTHPGSGKETPTPGTSPRGYEVEAGSMEPRKEPSPHLTSLVHGGNGNMKLRPCVWIKEGKVEEGGEEPKMEHPPTHLAIAIKMGSGNMESRPCEWLKKERMKRVVRSQR